MFVGRTEELGYLDEISKKNGPQCLILYGPNRIGKTELLKRYFKGKMSFFYSSAPCKKRDQMEQFHQRILSVVSDSRLSATAHFSWEEMFSYIFSDLGRKLSFIVIDEFSQLCAEDQKLPLLLRRLWDKPGKRQDMLLVISCSDVSFVKETLLKSKESFGDEKCHRLELTPLKFEAIDFFFPDYSLQEKVYCYAAVGGIPGYLRVFDRKKTLEQNIKNEIFDIDSFMFREPSLLLQSKLREPHLYFSILHAIACGNNRLREIAEKTGVHKTATLNKYLYVLRNLDFIKRIVPVTEKDAAKSRKGMYFFQDAYFRFWFRYIFPNMSYLEMKEQDIVWKRFLRPDSDAFVEETFVDICIQRLMRLNRYKRLPIEAQKIGRWWDRTNKIDVVSFTEKDEYLFCDCLWDGKRAGLTQMEELRRKARRFPRSSRKYYGLFSKSGFTKELYEHARVHDDIILLNYY